MAKRKWFVGENIRHEREFIGVTQTHLSRLLGWDRTTLCKIEMGVYSIDKYQLLLVATVLGVSVDRLCGSIAALAA